MSTLFQHARGTSVQFITLVFLCIVLMVVDKKYHHLSTFRSSVAFILSPIQYIVSFPAQGGEWLNDYFSTHHTLLSENSQLKMDTRILKAKLQKMTVLSAENTRLRSLLASSAKLADHVIVAELLSVDQTPYRQVIELNKGSLDGIEVGQAVIDDNGIMGQIIQTNKYTATTLLLSDPGHAIPVQFARTGLRSIAFGNGSTDMLELRYLPVTADIKKGDLLVSSGLGKRFPSDYPVAVISKIEIDQTQGFINAFAEPKAKLSRSREVLIIQPQI
ncbi:MAG: rod shape-determining protein MreC [Gammaproteobacteria bacterium]|nr:rod shape-determining protein MreC [Gammaproteobacteria bacterium]